VPEIHVTGRKSRKLMLCALSTCVWCEKTRRLLESLGVEYSYLYVDQASGEERKQAMREVSRWNPSISFPTLVIDDASAIVGFKEDEVREAVRP
jgi:glutaredoxin